MTSQVKFDFVGDVTDKASALRWDKCAEGHLIYNRKRYYFDLRRNRKTGEWDSMTLRHQIGGRRQHLPRGQRLIADHLIYLIKERGLVDD